MLNQPSSEAQGLIIANDLELLDLKVEDAEEDISSQRPPPRRPACTLLLNPPVHFEEF